LVFFPGGYAFLSEGFTLFLTGNKGFQGLKHKRMGRTLSCFRKVLYPRSQFAGYLDACSQRGWRWLCLLHGRSSGSKDNYLLVFLSTANGTTAHIAAKFETHAHCAYVLFYVLLGTGAT